MNTTSKIKDFVIGQHQDFLLSRKWKAYNHVYKRPLSCLVLFHSSQFCSVIFSPKFRYIILPIHLCLGVLHGLLRSKFLIPHICSVPRPCDRSLLYYRCSTKYEASHYTRCCVLCFFYCAAGLNIFLGIFFFSCGRNVGWGLPSRVLRKISGPKRDEVTGEWWKLHNG